MRFELGDVETIKFQSTVSDNSTDRIYHLIGDFRPYPGNKAKVIGISVSLWRQLTVLLFTNYSNDPAPFNPLHFSIRSKRALKQMHMLVTRAEGHGSLQIPLRPPFKVLSI